MKNFWFSNIIIIALLLPFYACDSNKRSSYYKMQEVKSEKNSQQSVSWEKVNSDETMLDNKIAITILTLPSNSISANSNDLLQTRLLNIVSSNGLGCIGGEPCFVLFAKVNKVNETLTNTIPQKYSINYLANLYVGNIITGEVYGSCLSEIIGVGQSKEKAEINALRNLRNTKDIESMLKESTAKIIEWYRTDSLAFFSRVNHFQTTGKYDLAVYLLKNVPVETGTIYERAQELLPGILDKLGQQQGKDALAEMKGIAYNKTEYNPEIMAWYKLIPVDSNIKAQADSILNSYINGLDQNIQSKINHDQYKEREELAIRKLQIELDIKANEELLSIYRNNYNSMSVGNQTSPEESSNDIMQLLVGTAQHIGKNILMNFLF